MREYLLELRKKANKTQKAVTEVLYKYGIHLCYSHIERGLLWKDLSGNRADILAEALETTSEYLLKCEAEYGGYVGDNYRVPADKPNFLISEQRREYDEPLTAEEKVFAQEYISFAEKKIESFRNFKFKGALGKSMCYEDFYDIGMLAFLRAVKNISVKMKRFPDLIKKYECPDTFFKHHFSHAIQSAYYTHIKSETSLKRKDYYNTLKLNDTIDDKNETDFYEVVPSRAIPVPMQAESSYSLDILYQYLSDAQIYACQLLISGWTSKEIISNGYTSKTDIGIIKFYLQQRQQYGKILWKAENYISGEPNVNYNFSINMWYVKFKYKSKFYSLGQYTDLSTALDLRVVAYYHISKGDFLDWYDAHIKLNQYNIKAFTYPLPCDNDIDFDINSLALPSEKPWGKKDIIKATKDNPVGILFNPTANTYQVKIQRYNLGTYDSFEKALDVRQTAERYYATENFETWYKELKDTLAKAKVTHAILEMKPNNKYEVKRFYLGKYTRLGIYNEQEALKIKELADLHIEEGDFDKWAKNFYAEYRKKLQPCAYARIGTRATKGGSLRYSVERTYKQVTVGLGYYDTKEEAEKVKALADSHIDTGDFDEWAERFRSERKANRKHKSGVCMSELAFTASYAMCKYLCGIYKLLCFDSNGAEHKIGETADVEEAYKTMDLANEHIEAGDFDVWLADYKNIKTEVSQ